MYEVKSYPSKNLLVLKLEGYLNDDQMKEAADQTIREASRLTTGFSVINDISGMKPGSPKGAEEIKRAQVAVMGMRPSKIIRITNNPISKMQFNRTSQEIGYVAWEVKSMEKAMELIEEVAA